jgi:RNA polymerase sigma-70 factor (ECF subfamily)
MSKTIQHRTDIELYQALTSAERDEAFAELYRRHSNRVFLYCRRIMGDAALADDIFQDTFLSLLKTAEKGTQMENVPGYILRIARNHCLRAKERSRYMPEAMEDLEVPVMDLSVENKELAQVVNTALELLPEAHKEAFVLQMYNDLSYEEIGEVMNVPVSTVRNWVVRAKKKLRQILTPYMDSYRD